MSKKGPQATPSSFKGKGNELSSDDSAEDIAAANEKMKQAAQKFAINAAINHQGAGVAKKKKGARAASRGAEEHTSTVRNVSKNIYKPCFNMPAKEPKQSAKIPETKA